MWKWLFLSFTCILACVFSQSETQDQPIITTPNGKVRGSIGTSRQGKTFYLFRGIRYAKPPVGDLRFEPPVPYGKWDGVYDATQDMPFCPQPFFNNTSEDCLMINVYTSKLPEHGRNPKRPVIVFIHDGGFYTLGGNWYLRGPEYFMDKDIVFVTLNYRLAILGFLSTGDELAPGNNAMRDQVLALKWVQENIEAFGGDENNITLLGYSAGGWSIILHMVSPMARGLFHKGIIMSGSPVGIWPLPDNQLDVARKQASLLGCPTDTSRNIINCLKMKSAEEIGNSLAGFTQLGGVLPLTFSPVIERNVGQEPYLSVHPIKAIEEGNFYDIPLIGGRNKDEFAYSAFQIAANETATKLLNENFEKYAPILLVYERDTERSRRVSRGVKEFYLGGQPLSNDTVTGLAKAFADAVVGFAVDRAMKLLAKNSRKPLYYYETTYLGRYSDFYLPGSNDTVPYGVVHQDEINYMFWIRDYRPFFNESWPIESKAVSKLTTLWTNFARTGNPTPESIELFDNIRWEQYNLLTQKYLDNGARMQMKQKMFEERYAFWERYYPISDYLK